MNKLSALSLPRRVLIIVNAALALVLVAVLVLTLAFTFTPGGIFAKGAEELDLRGKPLTLEDYAAIREEYPHSDIFWDIPFQGSALSSTDDTIVINSLTDSDVALLDYMNDLQTVHAENCTDYFQLAMLQSRHPHADVLFSIPLGGKSYDQDTTELALTGLTQQEAQWLTCLPRLQKVHVSGCTDYALLLQLKEENPHWDFTYTVSLAGLEFPWDTSALELSDVTYEELRNALTGLPKLETLTMHNPKGLGADFVALREAYPGLQMRWDVTLYGRTVTEDITELDISGVEVGSCEEVEELVACLPNLTKLIMSDCGIDNETMAAYRERQRPNYKVVWTVYLSDKTKARTDDVYFMPIQQGEYYFLDEDSYNLRYCEDMICLDLGHHMIHNVDFLAYMPHLKYLVLAWTGVRDISPIVYCQELVYLEVDKSEIKDYTPIASLKKLEDLNIHKTYCDITPLLQMTWLKTLWMPGRSRETVELATEALPNTRVVGAEPVPEGTSWRNLQNYYDMRDLLGMPYMR